MNKILSFEVLVNKCSTGINLNGKPVAIKEPAAVNLETDIDLADLNDAVKMSLMARLSQLLSVDDCPEKLIISDILRGAVDKMTNFSNWTIVGDSAFSNFMCVDSDEINARISVRIYQI